MPANQPSYCALGVTIFAGLLLGTVQSLAVSWSAVDAFTNLSFAKPVSLTAEPRSSRLYVCEREGQLYFFTNHPGAAQKTLFLDLTDVTQGYSDCGLLGIVFHPEFGLAASTNRGFIYVYYCYSPAPTSAVGYDTREYNRLSRFTVPDGSLIADRASELVLINQYDESFWHNGGAMFFGPDGLLYLTNGDEGGSVDQFNNAQVITNGLFSGVFRIDVDRNPARSHPIRRQIQDGGVLPDGWPHSFTANYYIPNDNPWLDPGGSVLEEFFAIGLRSPHRMTYDAPTGRIWLGDVGQELDEEIELIQKGGNYQWSYMEGAVPGPKPQPFPVIGIDSPPLYRYGHSGGRACVIGGCVYRGSQHDASLGGRYIFGDFVTGQIWSLTYDGSSSPVVTPLCTMANFSLSSFGVDQAKELFLCSFSDGKILKLIELPAPSSIIVRPVRPAPDRVELLFTNVPGLGFSVLGATNPALPLSNWTNLGAALETAPGVYRFTNTIIPGSTTFFFRVRQP